MSLGSTILVTNGPSGSTTWDLLSTGFVNPGYFSGPQLSSALSSAAGFDIQSAASVTIAFEGTYTGLTVVHEQTMDPTGAAGWFAVDGFAVDASSNGTGVCTTGVAYAFLAAGVRHRIRATALSTGTSSVRVTLDGIASAILGAVATTPPTGASSTQVQGTAATGAAAAGNPVQVGGKDGSGNIEPLATDTSGRLTPQPVGKGAGVSHTRPNDTTAYAAGDVIGQTDTNTAAAFIFPSISGAAGQEVLITSVALEIDITSIPTGMTSFTLYLYNVTPPSAFVDNNPWDLPAGDRASYLGLINLGTPVDLGSTLYVELNGVNKQVTTASASLFGYLVTTGAYTPTASAVYKVTIHTIPV